MEKLWEKRAANYFRKAYWVMRGSKAPPLKCL
jgi:hypothetical protein